MKKIPLDELMTYMFIETLMEELNRDGISSASRNEQINKLKAIRKSWMEDKLKFFLEDEA